MSMPLSDLAGSRATAGDRFPTADRRLDAQATTDLELIPSERGVNAPLLQGIAEELPFVRFVTGMGQAIYNVRR